MGICRYYLYVLRVAFGHSLSMAQDIIFGAIILAGMGAIFARLLGMTRDLTPWIEAINGWKIAASVFGSIILVRLFLSPYWIWKEQNARIKELAETKLPILQGDPQKSIQPTADDIKIASDLVLIQHRRHLIRQGRMLVQNVRLKNGGDGGFRFSAGANMAFYELRKYLSDPYMKRFCQLRTISLDGPDGLSFLLGGFLQELDRLENEWMPHSVTSLPAPPPPTPAQPARPERT